MKHLTTTLFLIISLAAHSQLSINAGLNYSKFVGPGTYGRAKVGFAGGLSDHIALTKNVFIQPSLSYESKGAYNHAESWDFNVNSIVLDAFIGRRFGAVSLMIAPYIERIVAAGNNRFEGDGFPWKVKDWHFWNLTQAGGTAAMEIDLNGAVLHFEYSHGITQVRNEHNDHTGKPSDILWHNRNSVFGTRLNIPLKTFKN